MASLLIQPYRLTFSLFGCLLFSILAGFAAAPAVTGTTNNEQTLIATLSSESASAQEKDAACAQLKRVGTKACIPALASLLTDSRLSHSARYILETMPSATAGKALVEALPRANGAVKMGIIGSLGARQEEQAVSSLVKLLTDRDSSIARASALALGEIGGSTAMKALLERQRAAVGPLHDSIVDGCLRCADGLRASGSERAALRAYKQLYDTEKAKDFRVAAYCGMVRASGRDGTNLMVSALSGREHAARLAALKLVYDVNVPGAAKALAAALPRFEPAVQSAAIEGLRRRNDPIAAPSIATLAKSSPPEVQSVALTALGTLGDASNVPLLAESAATLTGDSQLAARRALAELQRGNVTAVMLALLETATPAVQTELAKALGERGDKAALPKLFALAKSDFESIRKPALQGLALLADEPQLETMVALVTDATSATARAQAGDALNAAYQRIQAKRGKVNVQPLVGAVARSTKPVRLVLIPICSNLLAPEIRDALRAYIGNIDSELHQAAVKALCDTIDPELLPDLVSLAADQSDENLRTLAISACVRLLTQEDTVKLADAKRVEALKSILDKPLSTEQKRLVLSGLGEIPDGAAFKIAEPMLEQAEVRAEAAQALMKIAGGLAGEDARAAVPVLKKLAETADNDALKQSAEAALEQIQATADFIITWQVVGPFQREGKDSAALMDTELPPENGEAKTTDWKELPARSDPQRPWVMDLRALGGEQGVAYARTWLQCESEQTARLDVNTDNKVKAWVNDKLVEIRAEQTNAEPPAITLKPGWNNLVVKVGQNDRNWDFCARFLKPDGSRLEGLKVTVKPD